MEKKFWTTIGADCDIDASKFEKIVYVIPFVIFCMSRLNNYID